MPSGASKRRPHPRPLQSAERSPRHAGQASSPRTPVIVSADGASEDRVDERRERFHGRRENQDQAEDAQKHRQRQEPAAAGLGAPQAAREIGDRSPRARDHDQTTVEAASVFDDHVPASLVIIVDPATSTSTPHRRNAMYPSSASVTIGSPATLNEVLSRTGMPERRPYASSSACSRGAMPRSSTCTRAVPSTWVTAPSRVRHSGRTGNTPDM